MRSVLGKWQRQVSNVNLKLNPGPTILNLQPHYVPKVHSHLSLLMWKTRGFFVHNDNSNYFLTNNSSFILLFIKVNQNRHKATEIWKTDHMRRNCYLHLCWKNHALHSKKSHLKVCLGPSLGQWASGEV